MFLFNPPAFKLPQYPTNSGFKFADATTGEIVSKALEYVFVIAGLSLLVMLIGGGIQLMSAAGNEEAMKAGYGKIQTSLIGFLIIFVSFFVVQIVEVMLGVKIL